jgi:hypothetical protein
MKRSYYVAAMAAGAVMASAAAGHATTIAFGSFVMPVGPQETLVTDFSGPLPGTITLTGTGPFIYTGSTPDNAAPALSLTSRDTAPYLALTAVRSITFNPTKAIGDLSLYIGSLDAFNMITVDYVGGGSQTFTGADIAAATGAKADGIQEGVGSNLSNGRFTFNFTTPVDKIKFSSGGIAFEIADIYTSPAMVPEPASWAMMLVGIGFAGAVVRRRKAALAA